MQSNSIVTNDTSNLSVFAICVRQPKLLTLHTWYHFHHLRHRNHMVSHPQQPSNWLIVQKSALKHMHDTLSP